MDNIKNPIIERLYNIHKKAGYLDKYGNSLLITIFIFFIFFIIIAYFHVKQNIEPIKKDWGSMKCHPAVIPFAGIINKPSDQTILEFTSNNFMDCTSIILSQIIKIFTTPLYAMTNVTGDVFNMIQQADNTMTLIIHKITKSIENLFKMIYARIFSFLPELQKLIIYIQDSFHKTNGVLGTTLHFMSALYYTLRAFIGAFVEIIIKAMIISTAIIIGLWVLPFTWPVAATATVIYVIIMVLMGLIVSSSSRILGIVEKKIPPKPGSCFHKDTIIETINGGVKISEIQVGDILKDGSKVTETFKCNSEEELYILNGIKVTGLHYVFSDKNGWIPVKRHPNAQLITNDQDYVYCMNTTNKLIKINDMIFMDWDELQEIDVTFLVKQFNIKSKEDIHKFINPALHPDTPIILENGRKTKISEINVNDIIEGGDVVMAVVKIDSSDMKNFKKYTTMHSTETFIGKNIQEAYYNLGEIIDDENISNVDEKIFYHLVTDTGYFTINGTHISDYNSGIEFIFDY